jgi:hypothetical protein
VLSVVVPGLLVRFAHVPSVLLIIPVVIGVVLAVVPSASPLGPVRVHGPKQSLVTAKTLTGLRTVDLAQLVRVRRYRLAARTRTDHLLLIDARGARLYVDDPVVDRAVRAAVVRHQSDPSSHGLSTSQFALARLGLESPSSSYLRWRDFIALMAPLLGIPLVLGALLSLYLLIAKA